LKEVAIISADAKFGRGLKEALNNDCRMHSRFFSNRADSIESLVQDQYDGILIEGSMGTRDILVIMRSIASSPVNSEALVYFASGDFEVFQEVMVSGPLDDLRIVNMPTTPEEISKTIIEAVAPIEIKKETDAKNAFVVDTNFINVFIDSSQRVIQQMGMIEDISHGKPTLLSKMKSSPNIGIRSKIVMSSNYFRGSFFVSFPKVTFLKLYFKMVGEEHTSINEENQDFAGELVNIIYGQSKKVLAEAGIKLDMAIPTIDFSKTIVSSGPVIVIPFKSSLGEFYVEVAPNLI
jgi:chemotaxis protein CheX